MGTDIKGFLWLSCFCLHSDSEGSSRRLEDKRQEGLKYSFPLESCSSVIVYDFPWPQLLHGGSTSWLQLSLFPPLASSGLEVIIASWCWFVWVSQHPPLVPLTPPTPMKRIPNYENISLKYGSRKPAISSWGPNGNSFQWLPIGLKVPLHTAPKPLLTRPCLLSGPTVLLLSHLFIWRPGLNPVLIMLIPTSQPLKVP